METISIYLDNMFNSLPRTLEMKNLKNEILSNMEDKYYELKQMGKTENEAIGIVISEFGNIEELTRELGIQPLAVEQEELPLLTEVDVYEYTETRRKVGRLVGTGVILAVSAIALLIGINALFEFGPYSELASLLGLLFLFVLLAAAVSVFIYSGMQNARLKKYEQGFQLPYTLKLELQHRQAQFAPTFRMATISSICLYIISPLLIIVADYINDDSAHFGVIGLLLLIGVATFILIYYGNIQGSYTKLLEDTAKMKEKKEEERVDTVIGSIIWPLAVAIFMFTGFVLGRWDINWAVFPITGVLQGMLHNVFRISKSNVRS